MSAVTVVEQAWNHYPACEPAPESDEHPWTWSPLVLVIIRTAHEDAPCVEPSRRVELAMFNYPQRVWCSPEGMLLCTEDCETVTHWAYAVLPPDVAE